MKLNQDKAQTYLTDLMPCRAKFNLIGLDREAKKRKEDGLSYNVSYCALSKLANKIKDSPQNYDLIGFAHAVYGWMPTILKGIYLERFGCDRPIESAKALKDSAEGIEFLLNINQTAPINKSWIGTSKFLHFLNPSIFPIWDNRVAACFQLPQRLANKKAHYLEYYEFMHNQNTVDFIWIEPLYKFFKHKYRYAPTSLRLCELMLFAHGGTIRNENPITKKAASTESNDNKTVS